MTVRTVEGKNLWTGGKAIDVDREHKVISLKLRSENNLIIRDQGDNEIYVDLQLPDEITPTDVFPVGVTTGRVIVDNGWDFTGTIVCFKTTSGDNIKLYYADDGKLYIDNGTGLFKQIYLKGEVDALLQALRDYVDQHIKVYTAGNGININSQDEISVDTTTIATKNYVDDSINQVAAYYITKNAQGDAFATYSELSNASTFYSGGVVRIPTRNDYCVILADETHNGECTRYSYQGTQWEYQYTINETSLTQAQLDALNSGITANKVSQYDGYATGKQDAMVVLSYGHSTRNDFINAYNKNAVVFCKASKNSDPSTGTQNRFAVLATPNTSLTYVEFNYYRSISSHSSSQQCDQVIVYKLTNAGVWSYEERETSSKIVAGTNMTSSYSNGALTLDASAQYDDTAYGASWDGVTDKAPTKNAVYDKIRAMDTAISEKEDALTAGQGIAIQDVTVSISDMKGPCPDGFHVPTSLEWTTIYNMGANLGLWSSNSPLNMVIYLKLPLADKRESQNGNVYHTGQNAGYRSSTGDYGPGYLLGMYYGGPNSGYLGVTSAVSCYGNSIRPIKDTPVVPDSSWTILYGPGTDGEGIYWNQDGLISISHDGVTWLTIADKNLGATVVYNYGDTQSESNCGLYYQWGNNYGFPRSGSVTTDSTKVNASTYGPGNYYSSSTFITASDGNWDSSLNNNLWGGDSEGSTTSTVHTISSTVTEPTVVSGDAGVTYTLRVSNSDPAAGTAGNIVTLVP